MNLDAYITGIKAATDRLATVTSAPGFEPEDIAHVVGVIRNALQNFDCAWCEAETATVDCGFDGKRCATCAAKSLPTYEPGPDDDGAYEAARDRREREEAAA